MKRPVVCTDGVDRLMESLEGKVPRAEREALEAHVAGCPRCAAFIESYRSTPRILRAATAATLPEDVARSLRRFLASRR
jgi:anti-sigma factor RsiW